MTVRKVLVLGFVMLATQSVIAQSSDVGSSPKIGTEGLTVSQALEVCDSRGQREYLAKLICPNDAHPDFKRLGNFGTRDRFPGKLSPRQADEIMERLIAGGSLEKGEPHFHFVDGYQVDCGDNTTTIYLDMYHCGQDNPTLAPAGFRLAQ